jgi:hypothetical protein
MRDPAVVPDLVDPADQAMGLELQAIELEDQLEWAEAQGRAADAASLRIALDEAVSAWASAAERAAASRTVPGRTGHAA